MAWKASELPRNFPGSSSRELRGKFRLGDFRALVVSIASSSSSPLTMMASHHVDRYVPLSQRGQSYEGCNVRHVTGDGAIDPSDSDESDSDCSERDSDSDSEGKGATAIEDSAFNETTAAIRSTGVRNRTEAAFLSPQSCEKAALYVCGQKFRSSLYYINKRERVFWHPRNRNP